MVKEHLSNSYVDNINIKDIPFTHGGLFLQDDLNSILENGLIPTGRNIKAIDKAAGNGNSISFRLATIYGNFGKGEILIINPDVSNLPGVRFYTHELYGIGNDIWRYLQYGIFECPDRIREINKLTKIISSIIKKSYLQDSDTQNTHSSQRIFDELLRSSQFLSYLSTYSISKDNLYKIFEETCHLNNCTLEEFFKRNANSSEWMINEDICVPNVVDPKYFLGYWDGKRLTDFNRDIPSSVKKIYKDFILTLKQK